jgi:glutaconate CoA-transferase subunit B
MMRQSRRTFVDTMDFRTSVGFGDGAGDRARLGLVGRGPTLVITDLGILRPDPRTCELVLTEVHPGVTVEQARQSTGWDLRVADEVTVTDPPTETELTALRRLEAASKTVASNTVASNTVASNTAPATASATAPATPAGTIE